MYYKDKHEYKGTIQVDVNSKPRRIDKKTILLTCGNKSKEYKIFQPDDYVDMAKEKQEGHCSTVDEWIEALTQVVELHKNIQMQNQAA